MRESETSVKRTDKEAGSLASYIVVGVLLTVVLVSGLYGVQRYNQSQSSDSSQSSEQESDSQDQTPSKETEKHEEAPAKEEAPSTNDGSGSVVTEDETDGSGEDQAAAEDLPATGPEDTVFTAAVLFVVTFALTSFIQARYWTHK